MNTTERQALRRSLQVMGYRRVHSTEDNGKGKYQEFWEHGQDKVTISWGPRA